MSLDALAGEQLTRVRINQPAILIDISIGDRLARIAYRPLGQFLHGTQRRDLVGVLLPPLPHAKLAVANHLDAARSQFIDENKGK